MPDTKTPPHPAGATAAMHGRLMGAVLASALLALLAGRVLAQDSTPTSRSATRAERLAAILGTVTPTQELADRFGYAAYAPELPHTDPSQFSVPVVVPGFPLFEQPVNLGHFAASCGQCHRLAAPLPRDNDAPPDLLELLGPEPVAGRPPAGFTRVTSAPGREQHPLWSPDGERLLYVAQEADGEWSLWSMRPDGGDGKQLTHDPAAGWASWSPAGDRLLYWAADEAGRGNVWLAAADGSGARRLTDEAMTAFPQWTPDGRHVVYQSRSEGAWQVWLLDLDGGATVRVDHPGQEVLGNAQVSPDGANVAYQVTIGGRGSLWIATFPLRDGVPDYASAPDRRPGRLAFDMDLGLAPAARTWSPEGHRLAFLMYALQPLPDGRPALSYKLWTSDAGGFEPRLLTGRTTLADRDPAWSPDGTRLAFWSWSEPDLLGGIWLVAPDGTGLRNLTAGYGADAFTPSWSPDGRRIAFAGNRGGSLDIWTVDLDASGDGARAGTTR